MLTLKKWNGSAWIADSPKVDVDTITASGTPSSSTFLRGDGAWATPVDNNTNYYLTGVSGSGNGTVTFTRNGLTDLTWNAAHTHSYLPLSGGTMTGQLNMGANNIVLTNSNITGVNQLEINDPGEGIVFKGGASGDVTLAIVDDALDVKLQLTNGIFNATGGLQENGTSLSSKYAPISHTTYSDDVEIQTDLPSSGISYGDTLTSALEGIDAAKVGLTSIKNFGTYVAANSTTPVAIPTTQSVVAGQVIGLVIQAGSSSSAGLRTTEIVWVKVGSSSTAYNGSMRVSYYNVAINAERHYEFDIYLSGTTLYIDDATYYSDGSLGWSGVNTTSIYVIDVLKLA